jgi:zinc/manganese transport system substrate-binding protein
MRIEVELPMNFRSSAFVLVLLGAALAPARAAAEVRVATTTTDLGWMVRVIGGDRVQVDTLCQGNQDPHFLQARPSYMVTLSRADLLVAVGLELEVGWLPALIQGARNPDINPGHPGYLEAASAIRPIDVPAGGVDRSRGDIHPFGNPHFWLDPLNVKLAARAIADRLAQLDPEGATAYRTNLAALNGRIDRRMRRWTAALAPYRGRKIASYHATFNYFTRRFGLQQVGYVEDRPGIPPSPGHLVELIRAMRTNGARVLLHENLYDPATSNVVGQRAGAQVLVLPVSIGGARGIYSYEQLLDTLVDRVVQAFGPAETAAARP